MIKRLLLMAHAASGSGRSVEYAHDFAASASKRGFATLLISRSTEEESIEALRSELHENDALVVIGGDGSLHIALQAVAQTTYPVYIVPMGTGNDFARTNNKLSTDIEFILERIVNENPISADLGSITVGSAHSWFGQVLSTGFDSLVNRRANQMKLIKGQIKYTIATLLELPKFKPIRYRITIDNQVIETEAMLVSVANGPTYGGGMKIVPDADRHDGYLDLMVLSKVSKLELLRVFPKVFSGAHKNHPAVSFYRTKSFQLEAAALAYADGEFVGSLPIEGSVIPDAVLTWES